MLKQLAQLSIDADGRYATASELQFLKDYLESADDRISAYEAVRDAEDAIISDVEERARAKDKYVFRKGGQDKTDLFRRDRKIVLKGSAAAMLIDDLDFLRDSLLLWHGTILNAVKQTEASQVVCQVTTDAVKQHLTAEQADLMMPALRLDQALLG